MKKILALLLAAVLVLGMAACAASTEAPAASDASASTDAPASTNAPAASGAKLRFVTGGESGTYYAFGSVIAQHATNNAGIDVVGLVGNGSQSNVFELEDGNADLAFCQSDVMAYAYERHEHLRRHRRRSVLLHRRGPLHRAGADRHHGSRDQVRCGSQGQERLHRRSRFRRVLQCDGRARRLRHDRRATSTRPTSPSATARTR